MDEPPPVDLRMYEIGVSYAPTLAAQVPQNAVPGPAPGRRRGRGSDRL